MKTFFLLLLLNLLFGLSKAQCVFIYASEKIKGVEIPLERMEFEVLINDTLKKKATSRNDGSLGRISLEKGIYTIKLSHPEFKPAVQQNVVVNESRTTNVIINLVRSGAANTEEKKK
jgi:hypothetical protein